MVPVTGVTELVLEARDLQRSEHFYGTILGLPVIARWSPPRLAVWFAVGRHCRLGLWLPDPDGSHGIHGGRGGAHVHFAMGVSREDLLEAKRHLLESGCDVEGPVQFAEGDSSLYITDPDGNVVEIWDNDIAAQYGL